MAVQLKAPTLFSETIATANTEHVITLPVGTKQFSLAARTSAAFRLAFVTGKVATPVEPYRNVAADSEYVSNPNAPLQETADALRVYVASGTAPLTLDGEAYT
jgi:hypothetical protein